mgnify:FL=1
MMTLLRLKAIREERGISQKALAQILGVGRSTVAMWERGSILPNASKLPELADTLCCSIDALYGRTPPEGRRENR